MQRDFTYWEDKFKRQDLLEFTSDLTGLLWLKLRSIIRKDILKDFLAYSKISINATKLEDSFVELYYLLVPNVGHSLTLLDNFSNQENQKLLNQLDEKTLVADLYKVQSFKWSGDYTNSLDRYLVEHYVKAISSYDELIRKLKTDISADVYGYIMNSWYNHWTSILIEYIFKKHNKVTATVGQIKSLDFFVDHIPFDLKVTYLPHGYIQIVNQELGFPKEISYLKKEAKRYGVSYDKDAPEDVVRYQIMERLKDINTAESQKVLGTVDERRRSILQYSLANKKRLATWLYENQGPMRFGTENRLYLVLVDNTDWDNSWKLKRNIDLLTPKINEYLDAFSSTQFENFKLDFKYSGRIYPTYADILFIVKEK